MANYSSIHSNIWEDDKFRKLTDPRSRLSYIYSFSNHRCPVSGIYKISIETMSFDLGGADCRKNVQDNIDVGLVSYDFSKNVIWVRGKIDHDKSWAAKMRVKSVLSSIEQFKKCDFMSQFFERYPFLIDLAIEADQRAKELRGTKDGARVTALASEGEKEKEKEKEKDGSM